LKTNTFNQGKCILSTERNNIKRKAQQSLTKNNTNLKSYLRLTKSKKRVKKIKVNI